MTEPPAPEPSDPNPWGGYGPPGRPSPGPPHGAPYGPPQHTGRTAVPLTERLGARLLRRPEPRFGTAVAAAGAVLVLAGALVWGVGYLVDGFHLHFDGDSGRTTVSGEGHKYLGAALAAVVAAAGYAVLVVRRRGPLATAGVVAGAFGIPIALEFLTLDISSTVSSGDFPFSVDAVYLVSLAAWVVSYLVVPGARGRGFYVGLVAAGFASYIAFKAAGSTTLLRVGASVSGNGSGGSGDTSSLVAVGLIFGLGYYALAAFLDRRGRHGAAVGLVFAGFVTTVFGVLAAVPSFEQVGTGILLVVVGLLLAWYGGRAGRRFTTWAWTGGFVLGVAVLAEKVLPDSYTGAGVLLIVVGAVVAAAAQAVSRREAPDIVEGAADERVPA